MLLNDGEQEEPVGIENHSYVNNAGASEVLLIKDTQEVLSTEESNLECKPFCIVFNPYMCAW